MAEVEGLYVQLAADDANLRRGFASAEQAAARAERSMGSSLRRIDAALACVNRTTEGVVKRLDQLAVVAGMGSLGMLAQKALAAADAWTRAGSKIALYTSSVQESAQVQERLFQVAQRTRSQLEPTVGLYTSLADSVQRYGRSQDEAIRLTETINKTFKISGTEAGAAADAVRQFAQGLQSGVLRGDEFNSVIEQSPRLAKALAEGLRVPREQLRALAEQGALTADKIIDALLRQSVTIDAEYKRMAVTVGDAMTVLGTAAERLVGRVDQATGVTAALARGALTLADNLDDVATAATAAGGVIASVYVARGLRVATAAVWEFLSGQWKLRAGLYETTGHILQQEAALRQSTGEALNAAARDRELAAARLAQLTTDRSAMAVLREQAARQREAAQAQVELARGIQTATGRTAQYEKALDSRNAATRTLIAYQRLERDLDTQIAAARLGLAETTAAAAMAEGAHATTLQRTSLSATVAAKSMAVLRGALDFVGGPVGAALLALAGVVAAFALRTTEAEAATQAFTTAQQAARDVVKEQVTDVEALAGEYRRLGDEMRAVTQLKLEDALAKQRDAIKAARRETETALYRSPMLDTVEGNHGSDNLPSVQRFERMGLAAEQVERLRAALDAFRVAAADDPQAIIALVTALNGIGREAGAAGGPLLELARSLADPASRSEDLRKTAQELGARLALLKDPSDVAAKALLAGSQTAGTAASSFRTLGGAIGAAASKLADLAEKARLLRLPAGFERKVAELAGPPPVPQVPNVTGFQDRSTTPDDKAYQRYNLDQEIGRDQLRRLAVAEAGDKAEEITRQAQATRLLSGALTDAAKAHAQNRIELARAALDYPELGQKTYETLLTTRDFGQVLATLPPELQRMWAAMETDSAAKLSGDIAQATQALELQTAAEERLAAAAGQGEAAMRRARIENEVAASALKGLAAQTRLYLEQQERAAQQQIRADFAGQIEQEVAANTRLAAAIRTGVSARRDAEIRSKAVAQAMKEVPPTYDTAGRATGKFSEAIERNVALLKRQQAAADDVDFASYEQELERAGKVLGRRQGLVGAPEDVRAASEARQDVLDWLEKQGKEYDKLDAAERRRVDNMIAVAQRNADIDLGIRRQEDALKAVGDAVENSLVRPLESAVDAIVKGEGASIKWSNVLKGMGASLLGDGLKMAVLNPARNLLGLNGGSHAPTLFDLPLFGGGGGSGQSIASNAPVAQGGNSLMGSMSNWAIGKAGSWLFDQVWQGSWAQSAWNSISGSAAEWLGLGGAAATPAAAGGLGAGGSYVSGQVVNGFIVGGEAGGAAAAGAGAGAGGSGAGAGASAGSASLGAVGGVGLGAAGLGYAWGGYWGTKANSKAVGALHGAGAGALYGTMMLPGIGTIVGAIVGAIAGMLGTQKKATQYGGGWIDTDDTGTITKSDSGGENGIDGNDLLNRAKAVNEVLATVNKNAGISYGALRISTEYHEEKGHSTLIGGWEGQKVSSAEQPGMIALDILRAFAKDDKLAARYNFQAPEVVLKALRSMGAVDQETGAKILAVAAAIDKGNTALDSYIRSLSGVTKAARQSIEDNLEPLKDDLELARKGGIETEWKDLITRQFRAVWSTATSSFTEVETALAELDGAFEAYGKSIKELNLAITDAELTAAKAAQVARMRADYARQQGAQLNSARGTGYLNEVDGITEGYRTELRNVAALYGGTSEAALRAANANELYNRSLWTFVAQLDRSQLSKVLEQYGDSVVGLADTIAYASTVMEARDGAARADAVRRAYLGLRGRLHANDDTPGAAQSLLNAGLNPRDFPEMTATLNAGYYSKVAAGTASAGDLVDAYDRITKAFNNNRFSAEQYAQLLGDLDRAFEATAQRMANAAQLVGRVDSFLRQMDTDEYSVLAPDQQLAAAASQFRDLLGKVKGGDASLTDELFRVAQVYRELARRDFATSDGPDAANRIGAGAIDAEIRAGLAGLKSEAQQQLAAAQQQLSLIQDQANTLSRINATIGRARDDQVSWLSRLHALQSDLNTKLEKGFGRDLRDYGGNPVLNRMLAAALPQYTGGFAPGEFEAWVASQNVSVSKVNPSFPHLNQILTLLGADPTGFGKGTWGAPFSSMGETWQKVAAREILKLHGYVPGFAEGGQHTGGLRLVGEKGPELEVTGPARYWSAAQTARMLAAANDRLPSNVVLFRPPSLSPGGDAAAVVVAVNRVADRLDAVLSALHEVEADAQEQRARIAADTSQRLGELKSEVEELPRRLAGAM